MDFVLILATIDVSRGCYDCMISCCFAVLVFVVVELGIMCGFYGKKWLYCLMELSSKIWTANDCSLMSKSLGNRTSSSAAISMLSLS